MTFSLPPSSRPGVQNQQYDLREVGKCLIRLCNFVSKEYKPEAVLFHQGDRDAKAFLIDSGWGRLHRDLIGGERQIVEIPIRGDLVGHFANRSFRHEAFSAITELKVWEGSARAFMASLADTSPIADYLFDAVARQRSLLGEHLADIGQRNASVRTTHFLLELGVRLERVGRGTRTSYDCPLTQYDLAHALGLTAIHVNRSLREIRERSLLEFRRGRVEFFDYNAAVEFADFDDAYIVK